MELAVSGFVLDASSQKNEPLRAPWTSFRGDSPQVTAHRHEVLPDGDRFRPLQIGVDLVAAIAALEIRLTRTDTQMQPSRTGLRSVPRRNGDDLHARPGRLVADPLLKLGKTPFGNAFRLARLTDPVEVFEDNPLIARPGLSHDLFADAVIGVRDETPLATRDTLARALGALTAVGLERSSRPFVAGCFVADLLRRVKPLVRCHRHAADAEIDAEPALRWVPLRRRNGARKMQGEVPLARDQFGGAQLALTKLLAQLGRPLQWAGQAAFRTERPGGGGTILAEDPRAGVRSHGRMRVESVNLVRVARAGAAPLGNRVEHVLGGKIRSLADQVIARVMEVRFAMQLLLIGHLRKRVAGAVELFHRGLEFLLGFRADKQFGLDREVNAHSVDVPQRCDLRKGAAIPLHPSLKGCGWSILAEER